MKHLQLFRTFFIVFSSILLIISCSSDDSGNTHTDPETALEVERLVTTQVLSNTSNKTWKISQAMLTNDNTTIDISSNFNIVDDEFIFTSEGNLEWRQGNDINIDGDTNQETLLDFYRSPISSTFNFNQESASDLNAFDGRFSFTVVNQSTINGVITYPGRNNTGGQIEVVMTEKLAEDYIAAPLTGLTFTEAFTYQSNMISCCAPGMIGSYSDNSLFIVNREDDLGIHTERIVKFNIDNGTTEESLFVTNDFVSKQLHIINNQLVVIGGQFITTYPLDLSTDPNLVEHSLAITRYGMAVAEDDAYIIGGDLDIDGDQNVEAEKIYKWSLSNQSLDYVTDLPEDRFGARSTIVNNKLYVFGGTTEFATNGTGNNSIYIYDLVSGNIETEAMTSIAEYTYVDKFQNLIYVAGYHNIVDSEGNITDREFTVGTYNTEDGIYQEIETNLSQEGYNSIHGMCVFNNKIFVLYGHLDDNLPETAQWQIMTADL